MRRGTKDKREALLNDALPKPGLDARPLTETERRLLHSFAKDSADIRLFPEFDEEARRLRKARRRK